VRLAVDKFQNIAGHGVEARVEGKSILVGTIKLMNDRKINLSSIQKQMKTGHLSDAEISRLNMAVMEPLKAGIPSWMFNRKRDCETGEDKHFLSGSLNFNQDNDLKRLKKIKTLRGMRHQRGLPVRGQRTRSNFRKMKGKVVGVVKKKLEPTAEKGDKKGGSDKKDKKDKK